ncbi:hypothetical protein [Acinetobacter towneri]|uniref:tail fiber/spike domain-containing protein n=1 Tax=Acinetobacter towneri TaxID=202956 RepID=UPI001F6237C4|nr:hypothetical protein [Acinetobacter towneri]UNT61023.1 hypothetical protein IHE36_08640 [Acinetobacter towneri]
MADQVITAQKLIDADKDATSLSEFIWKPIDFMVQRRLAPPINTLNFYIDKLENYTAGLDAKTVQVNAELTSKANQAKASIDVAVTDTIAAAVADSINRTASIVQLVKDDINQVLSQTIDNASFNIIDSFELGATLTKRTDALRHTDDGKLYKWGGVLPKVVPTSSTPTNSGGFGDNAWLEVSDIALRQELAGKNGSRLVNNQLPAFAYGVPAKLTNSVNITVNIMPIGYFDDFLWGRDLNASTVHKSKDFGKTWELYASNMPRGTDYILPTGDGEILAKRGEAVSKSIGWSNNPNSVAWIDKVTRPDGNSANFLKWGFDGHDNKFIVTHYGQNRVDSRYVWISTDYGNTWTIVWDSTTSHPNNESHLHATCYDKWSDRFYFTEGHDAAAGLVGLYYSDDDGKNWAKLQNHSDIDPMFTTMTATDFGIVCGTDSKENGVYLLRRTANPDDVGLEFYGAWDRETLFDGLVGFADHSFRDPDTGVVYIGFNSETPSADSVIMACGAGGANTIYRESIDRFLSVFAAQGKILAQRGTSSNSWLRADTSKFNAPPLHDRGNLHLHKGGHTRPSSMRLGLDSVVLGQQSIAIGHSSVAGASEASQYAVAVGNTSFSGSDGVAIGYAAKANNTGAVAVGKGSSATTNAVAIGTNVIVEDIGSVAVGIGSQTQGGNAVAILAKATAFKSTAVGDKATASGASSLAAGADSSATAAGAISIGANSVANANYAIALGATSSTTGVNSVAIGNGATTDGTSTVVIGSGSSATGGNSTVVGSAAVATSGGSTILGASAKTGVDAVAVGNLADASGYRSVAIGKQAIATAANSVAIGFGTECNSSNRVSVGARDIESTKDGGKIYLKSPNGTLYVIGVDNDGLLVVTAV